MMNPLDHSHDVGSVLLDDGMVHFVNAERVESLLLDLGRVDTAFDLCDLNLSHLDGLFAVKHFFDADAAVLSDLCGAAELVESCDSSLHKVVGVR